MLSRGLHAPDQRFLKEIFETHCHALALYFYHYNWMRIHKTLRVTPAMASNLSTTLKSWDEILTLVDMAEQKAIVTRRWQMAKAG